MLIKTLIIGITVFAIIDAILMYLILIGVNRIYVKRVERLEDGDEE